MEIDALTHTVDFPLPAVPALLIVMADYLQWLLLNVAGSLMGVVGMLIEEHCLVVEEEDYLAVEEV